MASALRSCCVAKNLSAPNQWAFGIIKQAAAACTRVGCWRNCAANNWLAKPILRPRRGRVDFRRLETASHPPQKWNLRAVQTLQRSPRQGREIGSRPRAARAPHPHENRTRRMAKNRAPQPQRRRLLIAPIISPRATPAHRLGARSRRRDPFFPATELKYAAWCPAPAAIRWRWLGRAFVNVFLTTSGSD